jgi:ATP diphosphatase
VEETYEVLDEMDRVGEGGPWRALCEELGDLLFQIVFHAQLARELGEFGLADVANAISDKIVSRHPHVFEGKTVGGAEEVLQNWARIKAEERRRKHGREGSVLDGVPSAAPALLRAERLTEKASRIGFDWPDLAGVRSKLSEELEELDGALASKEARAIEHELGDVLFGLANLARFTATPAEDALRAANARFTRRFHAVEEGLRARGVPFGTATLAEMDASGRRPRRPRPAFHRRRRRHGRSSRGSSSPCRAGARPRVLESVAPALDGRWRWTEASGPSRRRGSACPTPGVPPRP